MGKSTSHAEITNHITEILSNYIINIILPQVIAYNLPFLSGCMSVKKFAYQSPRRKYQTYLMTFFEPETILI